MNEDYLNFYKAKLEEPLTELDELRKAMIKNRMALTVIAALCILIHSLLIVFDVIKYPLTIFISLFALPLIGYFVYKTFFNKLEQIAEELKELLTREILVANISPMVYKEDMFIPYYDFYESQLYMLQPEHYTGKHYMKGGKLMTIASIIESGIETTEGGWENIFHGYFMICEEKFIIQGITIIKPDNTQQNLGLLGQKLKENSFNEYEYVKIPNKEFSKNFAVYSNNVSETYKLANETVIEKILFILQEYGISIGITISPKRIYASVEFGENQFEFNHWKTLLAPQNYEGLYSATQIASNLIKDIGMSTIKKEVKVY